MGIISDFLRGLLTSPSQDAPMTEAEILKAIDELPSDGSVEQTPEKTTEVGEWYKDSNWVEVRKPQCWAEFKYIGKPEFKGLPNIDKDDRIYFTIPCGFEWDQSIKFWFITFPANCDDNEVKDFFTVVNPVEA